MRTELKDIAISVPIRRTRWTSFWVGVVAVILALLLAGTLTGLLMLLSSLDGAPVVVVFGLFWFGLFFLSYPLQRRYARSRDLRRPGISFGDYYFHKSTHLRYTRAQGRLGILNLSRHEGESA